MALWDGLKERVRAELRSFVLGPGVVQQADIFHGKSSETFQPEAYGEYLATSNPVYACANMRAKLLASMPLRFYKEKRGGDKVAVTTGGLASLMKHVNPFWTTGRLLRMTELSFCLWGEAFWFMERGKSGRLPPREIWWGRPDRVRIVPDAQNYIKGFLYKPAQGGKEIPFAPHEVVWMPYDNPIDEYEGLAPLAAARLAADTRSAAMKGNRNLFQQGMQMGGVVFPVNGLEFTQEQVETIEAKLDQRFKGVDKAHKWGVFRVEVQMKQAGVTPKDAEFLGLLNITLEDACRAYSIPLDLMGGQRTYENINASLRMLWDLCLLPEGAFIAEELEEKLLPMFPGEANKAAFDSSKVVVLQEDATEEWGREKEQIEVGAITLNEWRESKGLEALTWGDDWWLPVNVAPAGSVPLVSSNGAGESEEERALPGQWRLALPQGEQRAIEYDSPEHRFIWRRYMRRVESWQGRVGSVVAELFRRQRDSVLDRMEARARQEEELESIEAVIMAPFDMAHWKKEFRLAIRPVLAEILRFFGGAALEDLGLADAVFYDTLPEAVRFLEGRAQRFAETVNETTWQALKASLSEGMEVGEGIPELQERVREVMGQRIRSSAETIARTEVNGASNGGTLEAWRQSEVVETKVWMSALIPDRTRETHAEAHGQTVPLDGDFIVGAGQGPHPGAIGLAEEDISCLCTMTAGLKKE